VATDKILTQVKKTMATTLQRGKEDFNPTVSPCSRLLTFSRMPS